MSEEKNIKNTNASEDKIIEKKESTEQLPLQ